MKKLSFITLFLMPFVALQASQSSLYRYRAPAGQGMQFSYTPNQTQTMGRSGPRELLARYKNFMNKVNSPWTSYVDVDREREWSNAEKKALALRLRKHREEEREGKNLANKMKDKEFFTGLEQHALSESDPDKRASDKRIAYYAALEILKQDEDQGRYTRFQGGLKDHGIWEDDFVEFMPNWGGVTWTMRDDDDKRKEFNRYRWAKNYIAKNFPEQFAKLRGDTSLVISDLQYFRENHSPKGKWFYLEDTLKTSDPEITLTREDINIFRKNNKMDHPHYQTLGSKIRNYFWPPNN